MKKNLLIALLIFCIIFISLAAFILGRHYERNKQEAVIKRIATKLNASQTEYKKNISTLEKELSSWRNDTGILLESKTEKYRLDNVFIYSPLFENKPVIQTTYKYKDRTIIHKSLIIDNSLSGIDIWEYHTNTDEELGSAPDNFVTFDGYENYSLRGFALKDRIKQWQKSYTTKEGYKMYQDYVYVPKIIGNVSLNMYLNSLYYKNPYPTFISIWVANKVNYDPPTTSDSPEVLDAEKHAKQIADTIKIGK